MFLTRFDHDGYMWTVELHALPSGTPVGTLEFVFTRPAAGGDRIRVSWQVPGTALGALSEGGMEVDEALLRHQLELALEEASVSETAV